MSRRWIILAVTSSLFFLSQFYRATNAVIAPELLHDLSLDTEGLGTLSAAFFYAFAVTQIPIGFLLDRVGPRILMTVLSLTGVLGALVFASADSFRIGLLGRALLGTGMACNLMGTLKLLTVWFGPFSFATLSGLVFSIGFAGNLAATTPLVLLVEQVGWRPSFCILAAANFLLSILLYLVVRDRPEGVDPECRERTDKQTDTVLANIGLLFRDKNYWSISAGTFVRYGIYAAFQSLWAGPYLMEVLGLSPLQTGNVIFLMNIGTIAGGPLFGALSDRVLKTRKWIILSGLLTMSLILFLMAKMPPGTGAWVAAIIFFSFGLFNSAGGLMYAHIKELMPNRMAGAAMTGINFFTMSGAAIFMQGLGGLMESLKPEASRGPEAFHAAFLVCGACLIGASAFYLATKDSMGRGCDPKRS